MQLLNVTKPLLLQELAVDFLLERLQKNVVLFKELWKDKTQQRPKLFEVVLKRSSAEKKLELHMKSAEVL